MKSKIQKRLAADLTKRSKKKVRLDPDRLEEIKEAITKVDIRNLIKDGAIAVLPDRGVSKARARKVKVQKGKGRRKGQGSRKGRANARLSDKEKWMSRVRLQRQFLKDLKQKQKLTPEDYKDLYRKSKGGFFRSKRHIKLYIEEHKLIKNGK